MDKTIKGEPRKPRYKNSGSIQITFTKYAIRTEGNTLKLSISKEMQEKFKVKSLNFLIPKKLKKLVNFSTIKMIKIKQEKENKYEMEMIYDYFSKSYRNHEENMKKYKEELEKQKIEEDLDFLDSEF